MGDANAQTPITSARGYSMPINDGGNMKSMNMSYYSGFSGTKAFSGAINQMGQDKHQMKHMNLTKRENSMDQMGMNVGTPGY